MTTRTRPGRDLPRRTLLLGAGTLATGALSACSSRRQQTPAAPSTSPQPDPSPASGTRVLLAYFSRPGENYHYGGRRDLTVGNTEVVADLIAERLPVDVYRVQPQDPYPTAYEPTVDRNVREQQDDARPALANPPPPVTGYDTVLLGSPVWNVRAPMIMRTLLEQLDLTGKTVLPFVTHAVSGLGRVPQEYEALLPTAQLREGLAVQGEEAAQAGPDLNRWLRRNGLTVQ